jgi:hypothetical protein
LRGVCVATHLHVLLEFLVAYREAFGEEPLDLSEHQRVALDRCRVVRFFEPDRRPDAFGFDRARQATHPGAELLEGFVEPVVDVFTTKATRHHPSKLYVERRTLVPYNFGKLRDMATSNRTVQVRSMH